MDMTEHRGSRWRVAGWAGLATLMALPALAALTTEGMHWTAFDFALWGAMLGGVGLAFELVARHARAAAHAPAYRAGAAVALLAAFLLVWVTGAVGIVGAEDHPGNRLYAGVLAIAALGAASARLRPAGMAAALALTALAQAGVGAAALLAGWGGNSPSWPWDVAGATAMFTALWLLAAGLFRRAARR